MDFLTLAFAYTACFTVICYVLLCGGSSFHRGGVISWIRRKILYGYLLVEGACINCLPTFITRGTSRIVDFVFYTRNHFLQAFYLFLVIGGSLVYSLHILPYFDKMNSFAYSTYCLIIINISFFVICCYAEPGVVTPSNMAASIQRYKYDGYYYIRKECPTCELDKPARSKHCSLCKACINRFDHHCSWVNNCIGANNYGFFIGFIFTAAALCIYVTFLVMIVFVYISITQRLLEGQYVDSEGNEYSITIRHVVQFLLVNFPAIFTLFMVVLIFGIFLTLFTIFHFYLLLTNQTTNELFK
ncbi:predicted protein, partial [Nematostella vectensis]